jgi:hypothetical protein
MTKTKEEGKRKDLSEIFEKIYRANLTHRNHFLVPDFFSYGYGTYLEKEQYE